MNTPEEVLQMNATSLENLVHYLMANPRDVLLASMVIRDGKEIGFINSDIPNVARLVDLAAVEIGSRIWAKLKREEIKNDHTQSGSPDTHGG